MNSVKPVKVLGLLTTVIAAIMVVAGVAVWIFTASQLSAQGITVPSDASLAANTKVNNPISALGQAGIIHHHQYTGALKSLEEAGITNPNSADGKFTESDVTYAGLGTIAKIDGLTADQQQVVKDARTTANTAAGLISGLFTSVMAFGVALLIFGLGITFGIVGIALRKLAGAHATTDVPQRA